MTSEVRPPSPAVPSGRAGLQAFLRRGAAFLAVGIALYGAVYAVSEHLVYTHARRNRFFMIKTAPQTRYDHVILGASHAAAFDYEDMNARLEQMTGSRILNLSVVGGGVVVSRLLLEYFLARHESTDVVYVVDSFTFYSRQWNEDRLQDARLFHRAPFDPVLARLLLSRPATRLGAIDYLTGFSKINNPDRFGPDVSEEETTRFNRSYRPIKQLDDQRIEYLYPAAIDDATATRDHYLAEFENLLRDARARGLRVIVIKPPIPARIHRRLPGEDRFDAALKATLARQPAEFHDFSLALPDEALYFDTDHLNRSGVLRFFEDHLKPLLVPAANRKP